MGGIGTVAPPRIPLAAPSQLVSDENPFNFPLRYFRVLFNIISPSMIRFGITSFHIV